MKMIVELNDSNFAQEIADAQMPVLVDFYASWCGPCRMLAPVLESLANQMAGEIKFAKVNVDESPALAAQFNITGVPALVLFKDGQPADGVVGFLPPQQLQAWLKGAAVAKAA
jgi:thioredoxin 1